MKRISIIAGLLFVSCLMADSKFIIKDNAENPAARPAVGVKFSNQAKEGKGAWLVEKRRNVSYKKRFKIDPDKFYSASVWVKSATETPSFGYLCFTLFDADGKVIGEQNVRTVKGTFTELAAPCKAADKVIKIKNGAKWKKGNFFVVAFNAKKDESDLPNYSLSDAVVKVEKKGGFFEVTLRKPVGKDLAAGTAVREHHVGNGSPFYYGGGKVPTEWTQWKGKTIKGSQFRKGAVSAQVYLLCNWSKAAKQSMLFDNLTIEEIEPVAKLDAADKKKIKGSLSLPKIWYVFGPVKRTDAILAPEILKTVPKEITVAGKKLKSQTLKVSDPFCRIDLARAIGGTQIDKTAYVFVPFTAAADMDVTFGMGADWWFQAWLDGVPLADTLATGNSEWPPSIHDQQKTVKVKKGKHVLAVRFISGKGTSVLALGGPDDLRKGKPIAQLFQNDPMPAGNIVPNGGFESGAAKNSFIPAKWQNGKGTAAFRKGELILSSKSPISDKFSLEINTLNDGAHKRKLYVPLSVDVDSCYEVSFKAHSRAGDGYVTVSVREDIDKGFDTAFVRGIGTDTVKNSVRKGELGSRKAYYFFDTPKPYLVIQTVGKTRAVLDDICIVPAPRARMWHSFSEQREPALDAGNTLTGKVVTPHTKWAKPYSQGNLKVLSLMSRRKHRLTVELAQRLSMEYTPVFFEFGIGYSRPVFKLGGDFWIYDRNGDPAVFRKKQDTLKRLSKDADCIVIADINAKAITADIADVILKKVSNGTGLVIAARNDFKKAPWNKIFNAKNKISADWARMGNETTQDVTFYKYGKGLAAFYCLRGFINDDRAALEDNLAPMIKAMLWASRKQPHTMIKNITLAGRKNLSQTVKRDALPAKIVVSLSSAGKSSVSAWIDNYDNNKKFSLKEAGADNKGNVSFTLPKLAHGRYRVHFQLKNGSKIEDFKTFVLNVAGRRSIKNITLDRQNGLFKAGEFIRGKIVLSSPLKKGQKVKIRLQDADGNIWAQEEKSSGTAEVAFALKTNPVSVFINSIIAEVTDAKGFPLDIKEKECTVFKTKEWYSNFYDYRIWVLPDTYLAAAEFRKYGVSATYHNSGLSNTFGCFRNHALNNIGGSPWLFTPSQRTAGDAVNAPERKVCFNSAAIRAKIAASADGLVRKSAKYGALGYSIAHEWNNRGYGQLKGNADECFCPECLVSFRKFAQQEHGTLAKANKAWGTNFSKWDDVRPIVLKNALKENKIPLWVDHRRHTDKCMADFLKYIVDCLRKKHPDAVGVLAGMRSNLATFDSFSGVDYWRIYNDAKVSGWLDSDVALYTDSFISRESGLRNLLFQNRPMWHPDKKTVNEKLYDIRMGYRPWKNLLEGSHGFAYYAEFAFYPPDYFCDPLINADLTVGSIGAANKAAAQIRKGIAHMVFDSERDTGGIAILYSRPSEHAATAWQELNKIKSAAGSINPTLQRDFYVQSLRANGYQCSVISDEQIANGLLKNRKYRLLILPFSQAVSDKAAAKIAEFVKAGGNILADIRPAVTDLSGAPSAGGKLDKVFGVEHNTAYSIYKPQKDDITFNGKLNNVSLHGSFKNAFSGSAVKLDGAQSIGRNGKAKIPAFIVNRYGRGNAVLLNCVIPKTDENTLKMIAQCMKGFGLKPLFKVEGGSSNITAASAAADAKVDTTSMITEAGLEGLKNIAKPMLYNFVNGNIKCFGFYYPVRRGLGVETLRVTPPAAGHIYDLKNNRYLGYKEKFDLAFELEDAVFFATVPYKIEAPVLNLKKSLSDSGRQLVNCSAKLHKSAARERHVLQFTLFAPDGTEWKELAATVTAVNGKAVHNFELPLNMPQGKWKVKVREAISGLEDTAEISFGVTK